MDKNRKNIGILAWNLHNIAGKQRRNGILLTNGGGKFAYIKNFYYLCSRFLEGVLRTPDIESFLQLDYSDVGWRIHSAPIEHPLSIHWNQVESRWKETNLVYFEDTKKPLREGEVFC